MKLAFQILALWALLSKSDNTRMHTNAQLIPEVIGAEAELSTFSMGLEVAGLTDALSAEGPFTVFAPDNVAMDLALDDKYYQPEWGAHLAQIMLQHVSSGPAFETQFWQLGIEIAPLSGGKLSVTQITPNYELNNGVKVTTPDIPAENGIVHIVDTVILPPSARDSIMDIISVIPDFFSTLNSVLAQTGLDETLRSDGPYTLFAPSNEAFSKLNPDQLANLQSDTAALTQLLEYHISPGIFLVETLQQDNITRLPTLQGTPLPKPLDSVQFVDDLLATNGAMHIVNEVLFPPNGFSTDSSEAAAPTTLPPGAAPTGTIAEIAIASNYTIFVDGLNKTGWLENLNGTGPYTVFAVPDEGFSKLQPKFLEDEVWIGHLTNVMTYHIIPQTLYAANLTVNSTINTLNFNSMEVTSGGPLQVNGVSVTTTDIIADNGVIHVLEEVLLPPSATDTAMDLFNTFAQFSILYDLVISAGLEDIFNGTGPITAFAPIDTAFDGLPEGTLDALAEDTDALRNILLYHASPELVEFVTLPAADVERQVTTLQSSNVTFQIDELVPRINEAQALFQDLLVQNGVIQVIDTVLTPPEAPETAAPTNVLTKAPTVAPTVAATTLAPTVAPVVATGAPSAAAVQQVEDVVVGNPTELELVELSPAATVMDAIRAYPELSTLNDIIIQANLVQTLEAPAFFTVFAPTNAAFNALPGLVNVLTTDASTRERVLLYHIIPSGGLLTSQLQDGGGYRTAEGSSVTVTIGDESYMVNDATMVLPDVQVSNGVVHIVDAVLLPFEPTPEMLEAPETEAGTPVPVPPPTAAPETEAPTPAPVTGAPTPAPATEAPTQAPVPPPTVAPTQAPVSTLPPTTTPVATVAPSDDCVTVPGQTVCCPPGETTGIFFFCRYL